MKNLNFPKTRDFWEDTLKCPKCAKEGIAQLSQEDNWSFKNGNRSTRVENLSPGFKIIIGKTFAFGLDLICDDCDISAWN